MGQQRRMRRLLAGLLMVVSLRGAPATGELRVFENATGFLWRPSVGGAGGSSGRGEGLDITRPSTQTGSATPYSLIQFMQYVPPQTGFTTAQVLAEGSQVRVANGGPAVPYTGPQGQQFLVPVVRTFEAGQLVGPGLIWDTQGNIGFRTGAGTEPLLGSHANLGVRLTIDGAAHYGWVWIRWDGSAGARQYRAMRWGYETEAGVPAVVLPAPGIVGTMIAFCGVVSLRRRRVLIPARPGRAW